MFQRFYKKQGNERQEVSMGQIEVEKIFIDKCGNKNTRRSNLEK